MSRAEDSAPGKFPGYIDSEELAAIISDGCVQFYKKIPMIIELRKRFKNLKKDETIADCKTWYQFCKERLDRTPSAIRKALSKEKEPTGVTEENLITKLRELIRRTSPLLPAQGDGQEHVILRLVEEICECEVRTEEEKELLKWASDSLLEISKNFAEYAKKVAGVA